MMTFNKSSPVQKRHRRGFTLIEIMLALGIFMLLIAALYSTWILVIRATIVGKRAAASLQRERIAMRSLEDSLTCIQSHQASINYYLFNVQDGDQPYLSFTSYLPDTFPRSGEFEGLTPSGTALDYHLRRLTFFLQDSGNGGNSGKTLVLQQSPVLMPMPPEEQTSPLVLASNVTAFLVECWDTNTMQWDAGWDATNMLPPLVRVTLGFGDKNSGGHVITREISFPASTMPSAVQAPSYGAGPNGGGFNNFINNGGSPPAGAPGGPYNPYNSQGSSPSP